MVQGTSNLSSMKFICFTQGWGPGNVNKKRFGPGAKGV